MKIQNKFKTNENYLLLKENESITILADCEIKSSINIMCKNKKLLVSFPEMKKKSKKTHKCSF